MSNLILPALPGLKWSTFRSPVFDNVTKTTDSGREFTRIKWPTPKWLYKREYEFLRAGAEQELQTLVGFFNKHYGNADSWLFDDPDDNTAVDQLFGAGNGVTLQFQLLRALGGFYEPVRELNGSPVIKLNGVVLSPSNYTVDSSTGVVSFLVAPGASVQLTWSGQYYWRCKFTKSSQDFEQFMKQLWSAKSFEFRTQK